MGHDAGPIAAVVELPPRPRPEPGAMAEPLGGGVYRTQERPNSRGLLNLRNCGVLSPAKTFDTGGAHVKVFMWRGLFQEIEGRMVFTEQESGPDVIQMSESKLDFWDSLRNRWLHRWYGQRVEVTVSRGSFLRTNGFAFP